MTQSPDFIQIGTTAMRDPGTGEFLPSVPLYVKVGDAAKVDAVVINGSELARTLADRFGQYVRETKKTR